MRFKKPQVRYADTPQPATPYQAAGQVWDERIGSPRVQAKNWRLMAFGSLLLSAGLASGLVWQSARGTIVPWALLPVSAITGVPAMDLARKNFWPCMSGVFAATILAIILM